MGAASSPEYKFYLTQEDTYDPTCLDYILPASEHDIALESVRLLRSQIRRLEAMLGPHSEHRGKAMERADSTSTVATEGDEDTLRDVTIPNARADSVFEQYRKVLKQHRTDLALAEETLVRCSLKPPTAAAVEVAGAEPAAPARASRAREEWTEVPVEHASLALSLTSRASPMLAVLCREARLGHAACRLAGAALAPWMRITECLQRTGATAVPQQQIMQVFMVAVSLCAINRVVLSKRQITKVGRFVVGLMVVHRRHGVHGLLRHAFGLQKMLR